MDRARASNGDDFAQLVDAVIDALIREHGVVELRAAQELVLRALPALEFPDLSAVLVASILDGVAHHLDQREDLHELDGPRLTSRGETLH